MTMSADVNPLVSVGMITYNQERFVAAALESLLAQTYSPLEIVVCDDASSDGTYNVMEDIVAGYEGGHEVRLYRNHTNLGIAGNVNAVFDRAEGEIVVMSAGDDVSSAERVERTVQKWCELGKPSAIFSDARFIDGEGGELDAPFVHFDNQERHFMGEELLSPSRLAEHASRGVFIRVPGCAAAWRPEVVERFGPLPEEVSFEDIAFSFRAALTGGIGIVREQLLSYRQHSMSISTTGARGRSGLLRLREKLRVRHRLAMNYLAMYRCALKDIELARNARHICDLDAASWKGLVDKEIARVEVEIRWWELSIQEKIANRKLAPLKSFWGSILCLLPISFKPC